MEPCYIHDHNLHSNLIGLCVYTVYARLLIDY